MSKLYSRWVVLGVMLGSLTAAIIMGAILLRLQNPSGNAATPPAPADDKSLVFTDDAGRTIRLNRPAQRIVAGTSFAVELLMVLDQPPVLRPDVPESKVHPSAARSIPTFPVTHSSGPDVEAIAAARCDLIILHRNFAAFAPNLEQTLGVPVAVLEVTSVQDVMVKLELLGRVTGKEQMAALQVAALRSQLPDLAKAGATSRTRVLALFGTPDAFYAYRQSSYLGSMLAMLGTENLAGDEKALGGMQSVAPLNLEQALVRSPEVILIVPHGPSEKVLGHLAAHPAWAQIEAVRNQRVHVLDEVLFSTNPGPRAPEAVRQLGLLLRPGAP